MARKTQQFAIDGELYEVKQLGTSAGIPLGHQLMKAVGPALRGFLNGLPKGAKDVDDARLLSVLIEAVESAPTDLLTELGREYAMATKVRSANLMLELTPIYDDHFAGRFPHWLRWVVACTRFNFGGFFPSLAGDASGSEAQAATAPSA